MMEIIKKTKTDEAWERLYTRFEQDNLQPKMGDGSAIHRKLFLKWGLVAAAMIVGVVYCATLWMMPSRKEDVRNLVTQENKEITTLVKTLEDGSIVYLAQESTLQYPEHFATDKREVNLQGDAFFDIAKKPEQTFLVETEKVSVEVLGTAFDVRSNADTPFSLSVQRGKVKVVLKESGQSLFAEAGETVVLRKEGLHLHATNSSGTFDRYTKNIRFKDEALENVLRVINRESSDWKIETNSAALNKKRLTVEFSNNSPESVAELICWTFKLNYFRQGNKLILSE